MNISQSIMYTDMDETALLLWTLDYHMPKIYDTFDKIPEDVVYKRPEPSINSPAWIFGHMAIKERLHIGYFAQGVSDIPEKYKILHGFPPVPSEIELKQSIKSKNELISYYKDVRSMTAEYLGRITDKDLKSVPQHADGSNSGNPIREFFIMTIQHQYYHWGQLSIVKRLIENSEFRV